MADNVPIEWVDQSWYKDPKTSSAFGETSTTYIGGPMVTNPEAWGTAPNPDNVTIRYPLFKGVKTNVMYSPSELETIGELGTSNINAAIHHEPVHAAQYILYPTLFGEKGVPVFKPFKDSNGKLLITSNPRSNQKFIANDVFMDLASEPTYGLGVSYPGKNPTTNYIEITEGFPWDRHWVELDAETQGFKAKNRFPQTLSKLSDEQKQQLIQHIGDKFNLDYSTAEKFIGRNALYGF